MPTLDFKGKSLVYSHHLTVPSRTLETDAKKSLPLKSNKSSLDDSLIIHGDNLHALKALMPRYAGKVKCIYIDPPYNTGNEGWIYNDNVNSPMMQEWLKDKSPVDGEDLERHDKWLCMMWPRLHLLRELLAEDGVIFISIDDNEQHHLRMVMDEIFGEENFVASIIWEKVYSPKSSAKYFSENHDFIVAYARNKEEFRLGLLPRTEEADSRYANPDNDHRGPWKSSDLSARNPYSKGTYSIKCPGGRVIKEPPPGNFWRYSEEKFLELDRDNRIWWGEDRNQVPAIKRFLSEVKQGLVPETIWTYKEVGHTQDAKKTLLQIFLEDFPDFTTTKPVELLTRIIRLSTDKDAIILDSFAGSGTTAHAVLALNKEDGGNRKFILVECEDYADEITAERVRRVIKGVPKAKDETLKNGLGGSFTYCTLGDEISPEKMLTGENLPDYETLARHLVYTATGQAPDRIRNAKDKDGFFYETGDRLFYLIYKPDLVFLRSADSALNSDRAERIAKQTKKKQKTALVFATHKFMGQKELTGMKITFCGLPYVSF
ncbi:MAG: site-specific DNA-methyltransferase [Nitrospira sp. SB0677_bin_15]|nr:site-specific DNA-methyltransferase [Nitrospira sp. SB0667_bin_9]MYD30019.1 site-specific DNA-methyltransferase [Nitrospira sp. SB0661_bin_20]MYG39750.1 site-specific DNA-methyltransferase [Nitrospira sp. SB0677_bin_15]MYH03176.1 site-specific DNA-methyltransferase [Nitrospira sp. SB0675_bin_23]MYJ23741.1 site-specific DNA-methyltransferase [Nitrospira sp. SB0673_bin_12]